MDQEQKLKQKVLEAYKEAGMRASDVESVFNRGLDVEISFVKIGLGEKPKPIVIEFNNTNEAKQAEATIKILKSGDAGLGIEDPQKTKHEVTRPAPEPLGI